MEDAQDADTVFLDKIIKKLWKGYDRSEEWSAKITSAEVQYLIRETLKIIKDQPVFLRLKTPITLVGDLHGQFDDLLYYFKYCGVPPKTNYLFLGDYVDRKYRGLEIMCLLMAYKIKYRSHIFLLRGNHEASEVNEIHGFKDECLRRCNLTTYNMFQELFSYLPIAALVGDKIFCVHGGLSPSLTSLHQLSSLVRPYSIPESGLVTDLVWSDPSEVIETYAPGKRMISYQYGPLAIEAFMQRFNIDLIVRAHEMVDGYQFMFNRRLVTLFSAPEYIRGSKNSGAAMTVSEELEINFVVLRPICRREEDLRCAMNQSDAAMDLSSSSSEEDDEGLAGPSSLKRPTRACQQVIEMQPISLPSAAPLDLHVLDSSPIEADRTSTLSSSTVSTDN